MDDEVRCPLCRNTSAELVEEAAEINREIWDCTWCGGFELVGAYTHREKLQDTDVHILRGLAAERDLRDQSRLKIGPDNVDELLARGPQHPVDQADRFLVNLAYKSSEPGVMTALTSYGHRGYAFASATAAVTSWLDFLEEENLIQYSGEREDELNDLGFRLTLDGWRRVRELRQGGMESDVGFVAMPFGVSFDSLWSEGIKPAIKETNWTPVRADEEEHVERIDDWILNKIEEAAFIVADTTESNPGACFEAGFALGNGTPVIWTARRDTVSSEEGEGLHFDIRQYNHLTWAEGNEQDLQDPLEQRIRQTVGEGRSPDFRGSPFLE